MPSASRIDAFSGSRRFAFSSATVACAARAVLEVASCPAGRGRMCRLAHAPRYGKFSRIRSTACVKSRVPATSTPRTSIPASTRAERVRELVAAGRGDRRGTARARRRAPRAARRVSGFADRRRSTRSTGRASTRAARPRRARGRDRAGASPHSVDESARSSRVAKTWSAAVDEDRRLARRRRAPAARRRPTVARRLADVPDSNAEGRAVAEQRLDLLGEVAGDDGDLARSLRRASSRRSVAITGRPSIGSTGFGQRSVIGRRRRALARRHDDGVHSAAKPSERSETRPRARRATPSRRRSSRAAAQLRARARRGAARIGGRREARGRRAPRRTRLASTASSSRRSAAELVRRALGATRMPLVGEEVRAGRRGTPPPGRRGSRRRVAQRRRDRLRERERARSRARATSASSLPRLPPRCWIPNGPPGGGLRRPDVRAAEDDAGSFSPKRRPGGRRVFSSDAATPERIRCAAATRKSGDDTEYAADSEPAPRRRVERQPAVAREPDLDPRVRVVVGHRPRLRLRVVRAARESLGDARRDRRGSAASAPSRRRSAGSSRASCGGRSRASGSARGGGGCSCT